MILENEFASGGLIVGGASYLVYTLRRIPAMIWDWTVRMTTVTLEVPDRYQSFHWFVSWAKDQRSIVRVDNYTLSDMPNQYGPNVRRRELPGSAQSTLFPLNVNQLFVYRGKLAIVYVERQELEQGSHGNRFFHDTLYVRLIPGSKADVSHLIDHVYNEYRQDQRQYVVVLINCYGSWDKVPPMAKRRPDSVYLRDGMLESLIADAQEFFDSEQWYAERGIPWRRGYFFTGAPGNGKSTVAVCLASVLDLPICFLNLSTCDEEDLQSLFNEAPPAALIVIEDVDCMNATVKNRESAGERDQTESRSRLSLSTLLNSLDGIGAQEGRLIVMTSNHPEKLDPALIRPGRIDRIIEFQNPDREIARRMFERFFPDASEDLCLRFMDLADGSRSAAELQNQLLTNRHDAEKAAMGFSQKQIQRESEFALT